MKEMSIILVLAVSFPLGRAERPAKTSQQDTSAMHPQQQTGTVSGKIELLAVPVSVREERGTPYRKSGMMSLKHRFSHSMDEYKNIVVYLEGEGLRESRLQNAPKARMDQQDAEFIPYVLPIQRGTVIDFMNQDNTYHNVFSLSPTKKFNIGRRPTGQAVPVLFDKAGVVQIFCDIHSHMTAFVVVLDNPFFVQPDGKGRYRIDHVPVGTYYVKVWDERLSAHDEKITIDPGSSVTVNFILK
jgi:plastocyanin